jgi:hypothetical protein
MTNEIEPITLDFVKLQKQRAELLTRAFEFMEKVREKQYKEGKPMRGATGIDESVKQAIASASNNSGFISSLEESDIISNQNATKMFVRFEEMCRRRNMEMSAEIRPSIMKILCGELFSNQTAFTDNSDEVLSVTVYHGSVLGLLAETEFAEFKDSPFIFKRAVVGFPSDPRGFLRKVIADTKSLSSDERLKEFSDVPFIFRYAAVHNPKEPAKLLLDLSDSIKKGTDDVGFSNMNRSDQIRYAARKIGINIGSWEIPRAQGMGAGANDLS